VRAARFTARFLAIFLYLSKHTLLWLVGWVLLAIALRGRARRQQWFAARVVGLFRDLGATFVKVGQIMSTRPDLLPPHLIRALESLQDQVGAFSFALVEAQLVEDFGRRPDELFTRFDRTPIASASVAQVHRATLSNGTDVAVKVRRPGLEQIVQFDLGIMRWFAGALQLIPSFRLLAPVESVDEFGKAIHMQIDFRIEAENNRRFRRNFAGNRDIAFPELIEELCSERVLTMTFIDGVKVLDYDPDVSDPTRLARIGFHTLLQMVFEDGFVHADLHPGNILVTADDQVVILDLGLVAELDDTYRTVFARYFAAWAAGNGAQMARILVDFSPDARCRNYPAFEADVVAFVSKYHGKALGEVQVSQVAFDMMNILRRHRVRVNAVFTMVNIAIAVTEGIGKQLDPQLDLMVEAVPFFARLQADGGLAGPARGPASGLPQA
jgi:ubiquinone biosynthesis protein